MQPDFNQIPRPQSSQPYQPQPNMQQPISASQMKHGHSVGMIIALVVFILLFMGAAGFGLWALAQRNDFKSNSDKKVAAAVTKAVKETEGKKDTEFVEREKDPLAEYAGPAAFGSIKIKYPKTWSAYITENDKDNTPINGYFHPNFVPGLNSGVAIALHLEVLDTDYTKELEKFDSDTKSGKVKVTPLTHQGVTGARIDGEVIRDRKGSVVLLPMRDKTLKLTTESESFTGDFNEIILKNLTFSP